MFTGNYNVSTQKISKSRLNYFGHWYIFFAKLSPSHSFGKTVLCKGLFITIPEKCHSLGVWWAGTFQIGVNHLTTGSRSFQLFPVSRASFWMSSSTNYGSCKLSTHRLRKYVMIKSYYKLHAILNEMNKWMKHIDIASKAILLKNNIIIQL